VDGEWQAVEKFKDPKKAWEHKETLPGKVRLMRVFEKRTLVSSFEEIMEWARSYGIKNR